MDLDKIDRSQLNCLPYFEAAGQVHDDEIDGLRVPFILPRQTYVKARLQRATADYNKYVEPRMSMRQSVDESLMIGLRFTKEAPAVRTALRPNVRWNSRKQKKLNDASMVGLT